MKKKITECDKKNHIATFYVKHGLEHICNYFVYYLFYMQFPVRYQDDALNGYELVLPYPPSNNHYKGMVGARHFIPNETKKFWNEIAWRFLVQKGIKMGKSRLRMEIDVYAPTGKRCYDLDNVPKTILDGLQKCEAYKNDSQIDCLLITRKEKYPGGQLKVRISSI